MLYESPHVRISTDDGIATLWLSPPGGRIGAGVLRQLLPALKLVADTPGIEILVLRSGTPIGFGRWLERFRGGGGGNGEIETSTANWQPELGSSLHSLPRLGQRVTTALAELPIPTLAFIEGPCIGPGLELALACDWRLAVAGPDSWVGFGELPPGWGGQTRLRVLGAKLQERMTAREAVRAGIFDLACCERRGKIELRTWLDRLQIRPRKRATRWRNWFVNVGDRFADERRAFRQAVDAGFDISEACTARPLRSIGLVGISAATQYLACEWAMRGVEVVWVEGKSAGLFAEALRRGRLTPLEAEQASKRIRLTRDADDLSAGEWVIHSETHTDLVGMLERELPPRVVLCVPPAALDRATLLATRPQRVIGLGLHGDTANIPEADPDVTATLTGWLGVIGVKAITNVSLSPTFALA